MSRDEIINAWIPLVEFIAKIYGEHCEVILHDLRDLDKSIVAICNNQLTGRQVGGTITDYALKIIQEKTWENHDFIANYKGIIPGKSENIRSSTFFIKDEQGEVFAMLCTNVDLTALSVAHTMIEKMLFFGDNNKNNEETLSDLSITDMLHELISNVLKNYPKPPSLLVMEEKKEVVKALNEKGAFNLKGAVAELAKRLEISDQTIYRYLK